MDNEGQAAINLTLNGIYENLPELEQQGIQAEEATVVLIQGGILKLVDNRLKRTYAKRENSMINFYRTLNLLEGRGLTQSWMRDENLSRKRMDRVTTGEQGLPPLHRSIEKNTALLCPSMTKPEGYAQYIKVKYLKVFSFFKTQHQVVLASRGILPLPQSLVHHPP